jgi:hypothetical protein
MYDYLVNHAIKNVWCAPTQDSQSRIQPAKLSPPGGTLNRIHFQGRIFTLPVQGLPMYVFAIGQIFSSRLGIQDNYSGWTSLDVISANESLIVDLYNETGIQFPRFRAWYYVSPDKTTMLALQQTTAVPIDLDTDTLYVRWYRNAYFNTPQAAALPVKPTISVTGMIPATTTDLSTLINAYNTLTTKQGAVYAFVNGMRVQGLDLFTIAIGNCVEMVYDASIYKVVDFPVENLQFFTSTLDSKYKYLLHYAGLGDSMIDFQDDIDLFLITTPNTSGQFHGVYMHRNAPDTLRMVTHKDYSVPSAYVQAFASEANLGNTETLTIRLHIRNSGMNRPLVYDSNRIQEMYKMEDADVLGAMVGINSTLTNWQAATLEASAYTEIMGEVQAGDITNAMVYNAYGYNAITKLVANTPSFTYQGSGVTLADIPYVLQTSATVYEFDVNGLLLGWYNHTTGSQYTCVNNNCAMVEIIAGQATQLLDETYGLTTQTMNTVADYRMYTTTYTGGQPNLSDWQDVTGSSQYNIINGILTWLVDPTVTYTMVRGNDKFLGYNLSLPVPDGLLKFTLQSIMTIDYLVNLYNMNIPMGELDIWLNGHALIDKVDYIMDFPTVYIINKEYLVNPTEQNQQITVRYTGFCQSNMQRLTTRDYGFVLYDRLSNNDVFNLRDDQVVQITVGGAMKDRSQVLFAESSAGSAAPNLINGQPYEIRQLIVPMRAMTATDTYTALAAAQAIDNAVSAYLTEKLPEVDPESTGSIEQQWRVYSPFVCKILYDMINGVLIPPNPPYSDNMVITVCAPYLYLLPYDPTQTVNALDPNFVGIDPHNLFTVVNISAAMYQFLSRVVNYYCNGLINLSPSLNITEESS